MGWKFLKRRVIIAVADAAFLLLSYIIVRFALFETHGIKQFPALLAAIGFIAIIIAALFGAEKVMQCIGAGYLTGYIAGALFHTDGAGQGGGSTNNLWIIWLGVFIAAIFVGVIWELAIKKAVRRNNAKH